jgi:hypothetical protein
MENGPFIDDVPIKTSIYNGFSRFSMAMLVITRWYNNDNIWVNYNNSPT